MTGVIGGLTARRPEASATIPLPLQPAAGRFPAPGAACRAYSFQASSNEMRHWPSASRDRSTSCCSSSRPPDRLTAFVE